MLPRFLHSALQYCVLQLVWKPVISLSCQLRIHWFVLSSFRSGMMEVFTPWKLANVTNQSISIFVYYIFCLFARTPVFLFNECAKDYFSTFLKVNMEPTKWQLTAANMGRTSGLCWTAVWAPYRRGLWAPV